MAVESPGCRTAAYRRRRPEQTALYQVIQQHLKTWLALAREDDWDGRRVPAYVEREFRRYLACGILSYGFAQARCPDCGHDFLVAFSCKAARAVPLVHRPADGGVRGASDRSRLPPLPVRRRVR
jgi:hypothetical protein